MSPILTLLSQTEELPRNGGLTGLCLVSFEVLYALPPN